MADIAYRTADVDGLETHVGEIATAIGEFLAC